jgi:hypothetical protein
MLNELAVDRTDSSGIVAISLPAVPGTSVGRTLPRSTRCGVWRYRSSAKACFSKYRGRWLAHSGCALSSSV